MSLGLFALSDIAHPAIWQHCPREYCNVNAETIYCATLIFLANVCTYGRQLNTS